MTIVPASPPADQRVRAARLMTGLTTVGVLSWSAVLVGGLVLVAASLLTTPRDGLWAVGLIVAGVAGMRLRSDLRRRRRWKGRLDRARTAQVDPLRREDALEEQVERGRDRIVLWSGIVAVVGIGAVAQLVSPRPALPVWWVLAIAVAYAVTSVAWEVHLFRPARARLRALRRATGSSAG